MQSNAILARWAKDALREYDRVSGGGTTEVALIPLLIASLGHLADQTFENGEVAIASGLALYREETGK